SSPKSVAYRMESPGTKSYLLNDWIAAGLAVAVSTSGAALGTDVSLSDVEVPITLSISFDTALSVSSSILRVAVCSARCFILLRIDWAAAPAGNAGWSTAEIAVTVMICCKHFITPIIKSTQHFLRVSTGFRCFDGRQYKGTNVL